MADIRTRVEEVVARAVAAHALWPAGATVVVAVSGGADSLCLLGTLLALRERADPHAPAELVVAHLDHGLRPESAADAAWVAEVADQHNLRYVRDRVDVGALARAEHRSLEDAARTARYAFLRGVARSVEAARIALGHTRDDQVETLIHHWLRGSGLAGLGGMAPLAGDLARPLLGLTRAETVAYCAARGWQPRADPTNADTRFLRNRIRHELLPALEGYNPNLRETLTRNAALLADDEAYLDALAAQAERGVRALDVVPGGVALRLAALREQPAALRHRLLRRAQSEVAAQQTPLQREPAGLEARHIALLDALLAGGRTGSALDLPGGVCATLGYQTLTFTHPGLIATASAPPLDAQALAVPGTLDLPALGWRVRAWHEDKPAGLEVVALPLSPATLTFAHVGLVAELERAEMRAYLDADLAGDALTVRTWQPGDRFRPLGMRAEKKLQDYFADAKVPRELRARLPLIFGREHLLWVAGHRLDDRARLTPQTRRVLVLQLEPLEG